jgi:beta-1,4-mannosyl-glycoprotein beta-1,4-N-acetylglucosaminyltransferase
MSKVYDCFMFCHELDLLEIRFNILDQHVDYFVIGQSRQTFSGKAKSLYFNKWDQRWKKWQNKIIPIEIPAMETDDVFKRTAFQKDYLRRGLANATWGDIIYYGDVDEIWKPQTQEGKLKQLNYCYYLNNRSGEEWQGTNMVKFENLRNLNELRADHRVVLEDGGWHFTNMGGLEHVLQKLDSYDHQEMINDEVKEKLKERIENGEDYLGRNSDWKGKEFYFWIDEVDLPKYLLDNKEQYKHLWK